MFRLKRTQILPIGLDIGRDRAKLLQLEVDGATLSAVAAKHFEYGEKSAAEDPWQRIAVAARVASQSLKAWGFKGKSVVPAIPREMICVKNIRIPSMPPAQLEPAIYEEARRLLPFDADQSVVQWITAGEVRQGADACQELILMAVPKETLDSFIEPFHRAGLIVESLDAEPCALFRSVERFVRRKQDEHEVHVLIDIGARSTQVVIGKGRDISFMKIIDIGSQAFNEAVARKLAISSEEASGLRKRIHEDNPSGENAAHDPVRQAINDAIRGEIERLTREVGLCLRYQSVTFRGYRPSRARLLGGEGADPMVLSIFGSSLSIPVETARPLSSVDCSRISPLWRAENSGAWAVALGLALRTAPGPFAPRDGRKRGNYPAPLPVESEEAIHA